MNRKWNKSDKNKRYINIIYKSNNKSKENRINKKGNKSKKKRYINIIYISNHKNKKKKIYRKGNKNNKNKRYRKIKKRIRKQ